MMRLLLVVLLRWVTDRAIRHFMFLYPLPLSSGPPALGHLMMGG
jgi:hypothetical protein